MIHKIRAIQICIFFVFLPFFSANAIESSSTSYTIDSYNLGTGKQMNSTNFSVAGDIVQGQKGFFVSGTLPLVPGTITSCGKITTPGTYTLGQNLIGISGSCFLVQANNVTIDGAGFSVTAANANNSYAVVATSSVAGGSAYGTTTIQNISFSGFAGGVNAAGNNAVSGNSNGGSSGSVTVSSSTIGSILTSGGLGFGSGSVGNAATVTIHDSVTGNITNSGINGTIRIDGTNITISNNTYITAGTFNVSYAGTLNTTGTTLSAMQHFITQGIDYGSFAGGSFPTFPSTIYSCTSLFFSGTYTLGSDITGNCSILSTGITIDGAGHTINGNVVANNYGVTLSNINVTGLVSTTGAGAGAVTINNSSNLTGGANVTGPISGDGSSSIGNTTIASGGSVATSSVSFVGDVTNNGTIYFGNGVIGKTVNNSVIYSGATYFAFNASSTNSGTVYGNAVFNGTSVNTGTINGSVRFNYFTTVGNTISFGTTTAFSGTGYISGNVYDSTGTTTIDTWIFNASSTNTGVLKGNAVFNDTSRNTLSGSVQGNATFNNSSSNLGTVTGNSDAYYPVTRPLSGTTNGQVVYHGYPGLYFNDSASGHGTTGKWDDVNNWWIDIAATVHSPIVPTEGDDAIILTGTISTTTVAARVQTVTFQNSTNNAINITAVSSALDAALFNASSTNSGTITGNATFSGPDTTNSGTVTGFITRRYDGGVYTVLTDFTHNGVHWIVEAINGATVDLTGATYSLLTNIFKALNNGIFVWNNLIGSATPTITITSPVAGANIKWKPIVAWGAATLCQYKIDSGTYVSINCANNGSDIARPSAGSHTIFIRATDAGGNVTEKSFLFSYDNTQPVDTDCSSPLDENTRPYYYLTSNVGDCVVTATTTLRGDDNGGGHFYTVGSITGNTGNSIVLQNITAAGNVSDFKNINVSSSTIAGTLGINGNFISDTISSFGNTTVTASGVVYGGRFVGNLSNFGIINNGTTTPVTVSQNTINNGVINNGFIFNASSTNAGTVNGTTTLNDASSNLGTVNGNLIYNSLTAVSGVVTISGNTNFPGTNTVTGSVLDNRGEAITIWSFKDSSTNTGSIKGDAFFYGVASNLGTVTGSAYFGDASANQGTVNGNAYRYNSTYGSSAIGGTVGGSKTYYSYANSASFRNISGDNNWSDVSNWFAYATTSIPLGRLPITGEDITLFSSTTLIGNITNNIYIGVASTTLSGGNYRITGNVYGNGAYGGFDAYDFNLEYITVYGTTTAIGGDGNPGIDGGRGGVIRVGTSSTGVISVNGGDPLHNGGNAGTIYIYNTIAIAPNTPITAIGGDSVGCGFGGSGGNVTLVDTADYILIVDPGKSAVATVAQGGNCASTPVGNPGSSGQTTVIGAYNGPLSNGAGTRGAANTNTVSQPSSTLVSKNIKKVEDVIPVVKFAIKLSAFKLKDLPVFGDGTKNTFSFGAGIKNFFSAKIPEDILNSLKVSPSLLSSLGIGSMNDLAALKNKPALIKNTKVAGLFTIYSQTSASPFPTYIHFDSKTSSLYQSVTVEAGKEIILTLMPTTKNTSYKAKFNGKDIDFVDNKAVILAPRKAGDYKLTTIVTPIALNIQVRDGNQRDENGHNVISNIFIKIFNFIKSIFGK